MARQTAELLGTSRTLSGYVEIGTTGRYANGIRNLIPIEGPIYVVNDLAPSYSPNDIVERGQLTPVGTYVPMGDYEPFDGPSIPPESVDLVTNFIGFHHAPADNHRGAQICEWMILTQPEHKRVAFLVPVGQLHETLPSLEREGVQLDHLYDF